MRLVISTRSGARACDWESYALLRDNVQHYLEQGAPSERFAALHAIELAVDDGVQQVDAARLRGEVLRAWSALWDIELQDAAVSLRTHAILSDGSAGAAVRGTVPARLAGWALPLQGSEQARIPQVAARFIEAVLQLTPYAVDGDVLEVRRLPQRPAEDARASTTPRFLEGRFP